MNHRFHRAIAILLALTMTLSLAACGSKSGDGSQSAEQSQSSQSAAASSQETGPIVLTDQAGRQVELEEPAETLVSCYYITTYATMALGISDRVVGLEKKADTRPIYHMAAPELLELPAVGTLKEFNVEAAAALEPDLVLMPKKLLDYSETLTELGIPVLVVDPEDQDRLEEMLTLIGKACGVEDKAEALISYYDAQEERLDDLTDELEEPTVYLAGNSDYLTAATSEMYQDDLIDMAGGENAAEDLEGDYWTQVSYETLLAMDPDVIVIPGKAAYTSADLMMDDQLQGLTAVQNGSVYQMPQGIEEWDSPIPSGVLGAMWLTSILHGDVYSFEEFTADAQEFYQTFYGFELDTSLVTR